MKIVLAMVFFLLCTHAGARCEMVLPLYKGELYPIVSVKVRMLGGDEAESVMKDYGWMKLPFRYDFSYRKNGKINKEWTILEKKDVIKVGDSFGWVPANEKVRQSHPGDNHHVPVVVRKDCMIKAQVDWSRPAEEIP